MLDLILASFIAILFLSLFGVFVYIELSKKSLAPKVIKAANKKIKDTESLDPKLSVIESHKIMVNTLKTVFKNKKLTAAKMLDKVSKNFKAEKEFWYFHRMRNRIAHENDYEITKKDSARARKVFQDALSSVR